ncbi:MAG: hypothetical protein ACREFX_00965, partial [Opitutaceae bacterium]
MDAVLSAELFSFQPSGLSWAWGQKPHVGRKSYRGLFCGNDAINGFDVGGYGNFFSDLWDDTIGAIGKGIGHAFSTLQR